MTATRWRRILALGSLLCGLAVAVSQPTLLCTNENGRATCVGSSTASSEDQTERLLDWIRNQTADIQHLKVTDAACSLLGVLPGVLRALRSMEFFNCQLSRVPTLEAKHFFPSLTHLTISANQIQNLDSRSLMAFPHLEELDLSNNSIAFIHPDALRLERLIRIDLSHNNLSDLEGGVFRHAPSLQELDLSENRIEIARTSQLLASARVRRLNLANNRIERLIYDSHSGYALGDGGTALEWFSLAGNRLTSVPAAELRQLHGLREVDLADNWLRTVRADDFAMANLQTLRLSVNRRLTVVEAGAFGRAPNLHTVEAADCARLVYLSPRAFLNSSNVYSLDISRGALRTLPLGALAAVAQTLVAGNPFDCACAAVQLDRIEGTTILDIDNATCVESTSGKRIRLTESSIGSHGVCRPTVWFPLGDNVSAEIGSGVALYCAGAQPGDRLVWQLPNGSQLEAKPETRPTNHHFPYRLFWRRGVIGLGLEPRPPKMVARISAGEEALRIAVALRTDQGEYGCTIHRGSSNYTRRMRLTITDRPIALSVVEAGSSYGSLAWNDTLRVDAPERVTLGLCRQYEDGRRDSPVLMSLHNPWRSYNVLRLQPSTNYTFCLLYSTMEDEDHELKEEVYSTCVDFATPQRPSNAVFTWVLVVLLALFLAWFTLQAANKYHVEYAVKKDARMCQSVSGQGLLGSSRSCQADATAGDPPAVDSPTSVELTTLNEDSSTQNVH